MRGLGHPESPDRVEVVAARLTDRGLLNAQVPARDALDDEIERVHSAAYLQLVAREVASAEHARYLSTGDVVIDASSLAVARRAAGGAIAAMEEAVAHGAPVFALVRPPGHHAEAQTGMGFCLFNNVAIAARAFQHVYGGRVLILDFDYHHGNGTQDVVGKGLSYVSTHASPAYPGTGSENRTIEGDLLVNVPLPASGIATEAFVAIWERLVRSAADFVQPDAIFVSAGYDYAAGDPVGDLGIDVSAAGALARAINGVAAEYCNGAVAYVLEGGYNIAALTESIAQTIVASGDVTDSPSGAEAAAIPAPQRALLSRIETMLAPRM